MPSLSPGDEIDVTMETCNGYGACAEAPLVPSSLSVKENTELDADAVGLFTAAAVAATYDDELRTLGLLRTVAMTVEKNRDLWEVKSIAYLPYRVSHNLANSAWVDLDFACSNSLRWRRVLTAVAHQRGNSQI